MAVEDGAWIMKGVDWNHPECIHSIEELEQYIGEVGFLPLFHDDLILSTNLKKQCGFGKGGLKNYQGIVTGLMMQTYLVIVDFKRRVSKKGEAYGNTRRCSYNSEGTARHGCRAPKSYSVPGFDHVAAGDSMGI